MNPKPHVGMRIRIKPNSKLFPGKEAAVAYIGTEGISVYLVDDAFDECVPLDNDEWESVTTCTRCGGDPKRTPGGIACEECGVEGTQPWGG